MRVGVDKFGRVQCTFPTKKKPNGWYIGYFIIEGKTFQLSLPPRKAQDDETQYASFVQFNKDKQ
jgi:hypothetical protein